MESGAIDHVAINVKDIEEVYRYIEAEKMNTNEGYHSFPSVLGITACGSLRLKDRNKEKVEFSQYL